MQQPPNQEYPQTDVLDNIPFEEQRVIDELVGLWRTRYEPRDLVTHLDRLSGSWGSGVGASFFRQVYEDLRTDKRSKYAASSTYEFKQFLKAEYRLRAKAETERRSQAQAKADAERLAQTQSKAKEREEFKRRARADFDALGREIANTTVREELVELGRKRAYLAQYTGDSYVYENVCWCCHSDISSAIHARCSVCGWYMCSIRGSCSPGCNSTYQDKAVSSFLPDYPDDLS